MPKRRSEGTRVDGLPGVRAIMPYLMRGRNESAVYFEASYDLEESLAWLARFNEGREARAHVFDLLLYGMARTLHAHPKLNRFIAGRRYYQRDEVSLAFAMKPRFEEGAALSVRKLSFPPDESFASMVDRVSADIVRGRAGELTRSDREASFFMKMPSLLIELGVRLFRLLDAIGLAPRSMIAPDPMHASAFLANLGSLGLEAAWHHLYEYGNSPLFIVLGRVEKMPFVAGDDVVARRGVKVRFTYDERVEDGFAAARALDTLRGYLEHPADHVH